MAGGAAGRSRSSAYKDLVWAVATASDTTLDIAGQAVQALASLGRNLEELGAGRESLISVQVFIADMGAKDVVDRIWADWIGPQPQHWPQRACMGVDLGGKLLIELVAVAARAEPEPAR